MSKSAISVFVFAIYLLVLGLNLLVAPNFLLTLFGLPETKEVWIRVVGMLAMILGFYYMQAAKHEIKVFFRATIYGRSAILVFFIAFVVLGFAPPVLILFGVIDIIGAMWTAFILKGELRA